MPCVSYGKFGVLVSISTPAIVRGADFKFTTEIQSRGLGGSTAPAPFSNLVGSTAYFPGEDGTPVSVVGEASTDGLPRVNFHLPASSTTLLAEGNPGLFYQHFTDDDGLTIITFEDSMPVVSTSF